jgi:hypothetical protein
MQRKGWFMAASLGHPVTLSPCHPSPPYVAFGDIWGQMEAMDNGQWTVDSGQ